MNPFSAVLLAHTKVTSNQNHVEMVNLLVKHSMFSKSISIKDLGMLIDTHGLKLRSTHSNALRNLYTNLTKIGE